MQLQSSKTRHRPPWLRKHHDFKYDHHFISLRRTQVGFMFDNALPKTRRLFRFGDVSVAVRLVDDDPGAVQVCVVLGAWGGGSVEEGSLPKAALFLNLL